MAHIFTRTGDDGYTFCPALNARVPKDHPLIEAVGSLDEANSFIGLARALLPPHLSRELDGDLAYAQRLLFRIGYTVMGRPSVTEDDVRRLEELSDKYYGRAPLRHFILPSGPAPAAALHVARTVVRRAERALVRASREAGVGVDRRALAAANRLSSFLFAAAVYVARSMGYPEEEA